MVKIRNAILIFVGCAIFTFNIPTMNKYLIKKRVIEEKQRKKDKELYKEEYEEWKGIRDEIYKKNRELKEKRGNIQ
jgi:protein-arginine kinase activator protein McsA